MKASVIRHILAAHVVALVATFAHAEPQLNGMAVHTELGTEQFIAALYLTTPAQEAREVLLENEAKTMEIRVLADALFPRRFKRMWIEGIAINSASQELEKHAQNLADFSNLLRVKLRAGDILKIERRENTGVVLSINDYVLGTIEDPRFFDLLLRTWIGPVPLSSEFRAAMLSGGDVSSTLTSRFSAVRPTRERVTAVINALDASKAQNRADTKDEDNKEQKTVASTEAKQEETPATATAAAPAEPKQVRAAQTTPKPATRDKQVAAVRPGLVSEDDLFDDSGILDDEGDDSSFTAENLLSQQLYISKLTRWTGSFVKYPRSALSRNQEGTVRLTVTLARNGRVQDIQFLEKSQHEYLNRAAEKAVRSASPYPAVPKEISNDTFLFTVPVVFRLGPG